MWSGADGFHRGGSSGPNGESLPFGNDVGVPANTYVAVLSGPPPVNTPGFTFEIKIAPGHDNTGASTLDIGLGALPVLDTDLNPLAAGMMEGDSIYLFAYNPTAGGSYQLLGLAKPQQDAWYLNGNINGSLKSIGTRDNFDFPIIINNIEVGRFVVPSGAFFNNDGRFFINQITPDNGSNAGGQLSAIRPNRAQWRMNQYGANNAGGGVTSFKSRNLVVGAALVAADAVLPGDIIQGFTAIGVTNNALIPLAYTQRVVVAQNTNGNVAADWELSLCPLLGTTNSIRKAFAISSEGVPRMRETTVVFTNYTVTVGVQFTLGEIVANGAGAEGVVAVINSATSISVVPVSGTATAFAALDVITGVTSGTVATLNTIAASSDAVYPPAAGIAELDGAGQVVVPNVNVKAGSRFQLTIQDGGTTPPTGFVYMAGRVNGTSFTIQSSAGAADAGVQVYWQMFEPQPVV
jgi:hypothetical protein